MLILYEYCRKTNYISLQERITMSVDSILASTLHITGVVLKASFKLAEASAAAMEVTADALASWAKRAKAKSDIATIEEWSKITTPSKADIEAAKAKMKASQEASDDLNSK